MSYARDSMGPAVVEMARAGRFEEIRDMFVPPLRSMVTPEGLQVAWRSELERCGPVTSVGEPVSEPAGAGVVVVKVPVTCRHGALTVVISVTEAGLLAGIQLAPPNAAEPTEPWQPPPYADPAAFDEHDVTVGAGPLAVPGTLSLPHLPGSIPQSSCLPGPESWTATRRSAGTSRSRIWRGALLPAKLQCSVSTR
jgi:hypothetical protein